MSSTIIRMRAWQTEPRVKVLRVRKRVLSSNKHQFCDDLCRRNLPQTLGAALRFDAVGLLTM